MKKILFFMPNIERGGIEKNLIILSNYFINENYEIELIYSNISKLFEKKLHKKIKKIKVKKIFKFNFLNRRIQGSLNCFFYLIFSKIYFSNQIILSFQDHPIPILVSKLKKIKCVLRIANHPIGSLKYYNNKIFFFFKLIIKILFYKFADGIICNSKASSSFLKQKLKKKNIITIYNPLNLKKISKVGKKKYQIISVGRLQNQKNFHGLIHAFYGIKDKFLNLKLLIVGSGSYKKSLEDLARKLKLSKRIFFIKYQNPNELIKKSKIFVLNSLWEGLPNILIETQNLLTPIISTDCLSGPREILNNGEYGYLAKVNDNKDMIKKITYVLKNYKEAKNKANKGFQNLYRFDEKKQCQKYKRFLDKLI